MKKKNRNESMEDTYTFLFYSFYGTYRHNNKIPVIWYILGVRVHLEAHILVIDFQICHGWYPENQFS